MRVISKKRINEYAILRPDAKNSLEHWYETVSDAEWSSFSDVRNTFRSADHVPLSGGSVYVFDIGGNNHRMIAGINYETKVVYVKLLMTHAEYGKNTWQTQVAVK